MGVTGDAHVSLTSITLHRKEQRGNLEMSSKSHCHASSPTLLGLLGNRDMSW